MAKDPGAIVAPHSYHPYSLMTIGILLKEKRNYIAIECAIRSIRSNMCPSVASHQVYLSTSPVRDHCRPDAIRLYTLGQYVEPVLFLGIVE